MCICALVPALSTRTRLLLVLHRDEERKPTNTGRLATLCLPDSEVVVRGGRQGEPELALPADRQPLLLFPYEDAVPLARFAGCARPVTLIVPDGTWRQAGKMKKRMPALRDVPCVSIPEGEETDYRLRAERKAGGLATMEAIARAFGILEGPEVEAELAKIFRIMVARTLWIRGALRSDQVEGGLPPGATRDPLSHPKSSE